MVILTGPHSGTTISSACAGLRHPGRLSISPGEHATSHLNPGMQATEVTVTAEGGVLLFRLLFIFVRDKNYIPAPLKALMPKNPTI